MKKIIILILILVFSHVNANTSDEKIFSTLPGETIADMLFSPNGKNIFYSTYGKRTYMYAYYNGRKYSDYEFYARHEDEIKDNVVFSPDSNNLAFIGKKDSKWCIITNMGKSFCHDEVRLPRFSGDSKDLFYFGKINGIWSLYKNGEKIYTETEKRGYPRLLQVSYDGNSYGYLSPGEDEYAYNLKIIKNGVVIGNSKNITKVLFSPDFSNHIYVLNGEVYINGKKIGGNNGKYPDINIYYTKDGQHSIVVVTNTDNNSIYYIIDGIQGKTYFFNTETILGGSSLGIPSNIIFSQNGKNNAYYINDSKGSILYKNNKEFKRYDYQIVGLDYKGDDLSLIGCKRKSGGWDGVCNLVKNGKIENNLNYYNESFKYINGSLFGIVSVGFNTENETKMLYKNGNKIFEGKYIDKDFNVSPNGEYFINSYGEYINNMVQTKIYVNGLDISNKRVVINLPDYIVSQNFYKLAYVVSDSKNNRSYIVTKIIDKSKEVLANSEINEDQKNDLVLILPEKLKDGLDKKISSMKLENGMEDTEGQVKFIEKVISNINKLYKKNPSEKNKNLLKELKNYLVNKSYEIQDILELDDLFSE